jgi:polyhydroxybutyrate depolymerase
MKFLLILAVFMPFLKPWSSLHAQTGDLVNKSFIHENISRNYTIYVPEDYSADESWPLIVNFHGYSGDVQDHIDRTQMHDLADKNRFLIAYPEGININRASGILPSFVPLSGSGWSVPGFTTQRDEIAFFESLLSHIENEYSVNKNRIHTSGLSLGGYMALYVALMLPDRIASFASVAGHMTERVEELITAETSISGLLVHGTEDIVTNYNGLQGFYLSVLETANNLAGQIGCSEDPISTNLDDLNTSDGTTVTKLEYTDCDNAMEITVFTINNGGHRWPGSGRVEPSVLGNNSLDVNVSEEIVQFFAENRLVTSNDELEDGLMLGTYQLNQNYPNPFNPSTNIRYSLPKTDEVQLSVYNILGQEVKRLVNGEQSAGWHTVSFKALDLSSGFYIYRIQAGEFVAIKKLLLIK